MLYYSIVLCTCCTSVFRISPASANQPNQQPRSLCLSLSLALSPSLPLFLCLSHVLSALCQAHSMTFVLGLTCAHGACMLSATRFVLGSRELRRYPLSRSLASEESGEPPPLKHGMFGILWAKLRINQICSMRFPYHACAFLLPAALIILCVVGSSRLQQVPHSSATHTRNLV